MPLLDNDKDVLPLSSIAELLNAKIRTLKMYEEKGLLPEKKGKKLYSINDVKIITLVYYLANVKKINTNGIKFILEMINNNMDQEHKDKYLTSLEEKMEKLSKSDIKEVEVV